MKKKPAKIEKRPAAKALVAKKPRKASQKKRDVKRVKLHSKKAIGRVLTKKPEIKRAPTRRAVIEGKVDRTEKPVFNFFDWGGEHSTDIQRNYSTIIVPHSLALRWL